MLFRFLKQFFPVRQFHAIRFLHGRRRESFRGLQVEGTNFLTKIAARDPGADRRAIIGADFQFTSILKRPVRDAAIGIQEMRFSESLSWARLKAARASPAIIRERSRLATCFLIDENLAEEKIASVLGMDKKRVFSDPTEASKRGPGALENRARVDADFPSQGAFRSRGFFHNPLQAFRDFQMVVWSSGVSCVSHAFLDAGRAERSWVMGKRDAKNAFCFRKNKLGIGAAITTSSEISHFARVTRGEPSVVARDVLAQLIPREIDIHDTYERKSLFTS